MRGLVIAVMLALSGCAAPPPYAVGITERVSGDYQPAEDDRLAVLTRSQAYWSALAEGRWRDAYAMHTLDYQEKVAFDTWRAQPHRAWGAWPHTVSIHWLRQAARIHGPELYAVVDWSARAGAKGSTGRLIWRQHPDGRFELESSEIKVLIPKRP